MPKYKFAASAYVSGKNYREGDEAEFTKESAAALGILVKPAGAQTKEVEAPAEDRAIKKAPAKK